LYALQLHKLREQLKYEGRLDLLKVRRCNNVPDSIFDKLFYVSAVMVLQLQNCLYVHFTLVWMGKMTTCDMMLSRSNFVKFIVNKIKFIKFKDTIEEMGHNNDWSSDDNESE